MRQPRTVLTASVTLACLAVLAARTAAQAPVIYGSHNSPPQLYAIDTQTGQATLVKSGLPYTQVALGRGPQTDLVYMIGNAGTNAITTWNPATDEVVEVTPGFSRQYHRFDADAGGNFYGVELNSKAVFEMDALTGQPSLVGNMTGLGSGGASGDMAFAPGATGEFYYAIDSSLYKVALPGLAVQFLGFTGTSEEIEGLAFDREGVLYANTAFHLWRLNLGTGAATLVGPTLAPKLNDLANGLDPLFLQATPTSVAVGQNLTLLAREGGVGLPGALVVTEVGGVPTAVLTLLSVFSPTCEYSRSGNVPAPLAGLTVKFRALGFTKFDTLVLTNEVTVSIE